MGAVLGLLPITGVPLPLISAGVSSLIVTMAALGMLMAFARSEPGAAQALADGRAVPRRLLGWLGLGVGLRCGEAGCRQAVGRAHGGPAEVGGPVEAGEAAWA